MGTLSSVQPGTPKWVYLHLNDFDIDCLWVEAVVHKSVYHFVLFTSDGFEVLKWIQIKYDWTLLYMLKYVAVKLCGSREIDDMSYSLQVLCSRNVSLLPWM